MNLDEAFPSKYLKASDLPEEGSEAFTIEEVKLEDVGMGNKKEKKLLISFAESDKDLICNKTNSNTIAKVLGTKETDEWVGQMINLYRAEVEFQGDMVESIRVRLKSPSRAKPAEVTEPDQGEDKLGEDPF